MVCQARLTATATTTSLPPATATEAPTPTNTPEPPLIILWTGEGANAQIIGDLQTSLAQLAKQDGLRFQTINSPMSPDQARQAKVVVAISPGAELEGLTSAAPDTQFLAIAGVSGLKADKNLTISVGQGARLDQLGFLAGYLAAVVTKDWRVGVISQANSRSGNSSSNSLYQRGGVLLRLMPSSLSALRAVPCFCATGSRVR